MMIDSLDQDTYNAAYAFVVIMHNRIKHKDYCDATGRPIVNVTDLVNCLVDDKMAPSDWTGRRGENNDRHLANRT